MEGTDLFYWPITIDATNKSFTFVEDSTDYVITLDEATYCTYKGSTVGSYPPLYTEILTKINAVTSNTYAFNAQTPSGSDLINSGLQLEATSGSLDYGYKFSTAYTFDARLLGYASGESSDQTTSGTTLDSPFSRYGVWQPWYHAPHSHSDKRGWTLRVQSEGMGDYDQVVDSRWRSDQIRLLIYEYQPAAFVKENRGDKSDYASTAGLPTGDVHNAFESLWLECLSDFSKECIIVHDLTTVDLEISTHSYEIGKLFDPEHRKDLRNLVEIMELRGEYYEIAILMWINTSNYSF